MSNILITGATGFLGSHLCMQLVDIGANVIILERDGLPYTYLRDWAYDENVIHVHGDTRDYDTIKRAMIEYEITNVYHLASQAIVRQAEVDPRLTFEQNVMGALNVLEASRLCGVKRVLLTTSDKAYGDSTTLPYTEDMPLQGKHPYACSKSCEDLIAQMYYQTYGLSVVILRSGNMYGPGDLNYSRIIPKTIRNLMTGQPPLVYGNGSMIRDYTYVEDCADACIFLMDNAPNGAYNVSGESVLSVNEVVEKVSDALDIRIPPLYQGCNNEIDSQWLDISKIKALGWKPKHTFEDGLKKTIEYYKGAR